MNSLSMFILTITLSSQSACTNDSLPTKVRGDSSVFVYEVPSTRFTEIFDLSRNMIITGGPDLQRNPAAAESEFSGPLDSCDSGDFFCLTSGLHVAIPRTQMRDAWSMGDLSCQATPIPEELYRINCRVRGRGISSRLIYSRSRGIVSYERICPGCPSQVFELVGRQGLFSVVSNTMAPQG